MPRFTSTIVTARITKLLQLCPHLSMKRPFHPSKIKLNHHSSNRQHRANLRFLSSACVFIPAELEEKHWWSNFLVNAKPFNASSEFALLNGKLQILQHELNQYNELHETTQERKCGLPFPSMLRRQQSFELVNLPARPALAWEEQGLNWSHLPNLYLQLGKSRLSTLVVVTALGGYVAAAQTHGFSLVPMLALWAGVYGTAFGANTLNQCLEVPYDAQMKRTQQRVLPRGAMSTTHAAAFGVLSGAAGVAALYFGANPTTAMLGLANILLYTSIYTPMKRYTIYNTWVGALVGAVPPLMGWTACCSGSLEGASVVLASVLFAWQFPHFNALSWNLRTDYTKAGYRMMAVCRPDLLKRTSLTYTASLAPICSLLAPMTGLTNWTFAVVSLPLNLYFTLLAWRFYTETDSRNSKKLFRCSLAYLPVLLALMLICRPKIGDEITPKIRN